MKILFVKHSLAWPRSSGHDVHTYHLMRALGELGHEISLATLIEPSSDAIAGLDLHRKLLLPEQAEGPGAENGLELTRLQERFRSYWGIDPSHICAVGSAIRANQVDAVAAVGLDALPFLAAAKKCERIWYAGDELLWHHLSLLQPWRIQTWSHVREAAIKGLYERAYHGHMDRVWVVSEADRRAMRMVTGVKQVDVIPNGVDTDYYRPLDVAQHANSCVFWGRLDFEPNIQALEWFVTHVWPVVRDKVPDARFQIYGFRLTEDVKRLARGDGIDLQADLPDIRRDICRHQVVVMPFQSGGGVKNKVLEAASLAKPIVCTRRVRNGLNNVEASSLIVADDRSSWVRELVSLWTDAPRRQAVGTASRAWVTACHSWRASAERASHRATRNPTATDSA